MHAAGKIFDKTYLKAIRDAFFPNMWNSPLCDIEVPKEGESLNLQTCRETLPLPVPSFNGISWSAYCNDFLSKQKIYSI